MNKIIPSFLLSALGPLAALAAGITITTEDNIDGHSVTYTWSLDYNPADNSVAIQGLSPKPALNFTVPATFLGSDGVTVLVVKAIDDEAFAECQGLTSVSLPSTLLTIGNKAFADCTSLLSVTISEGVRYIGARAFQNTSISSLAIPSTLLDMGGNIGAGALFNGNISIGDSSHFCYSEDGVLYNYDKTKLYACPTRAEGTINIPQSVTNICEDAFFGCHRLSYLNIPTSVSVIGDGAFNVGGIWSELDAPESTPRLESVFYQGAAPAASDNIYLGTPTTLVSYVFSDDWPATWKGRPVTVISETNPPVLSAVVDGLTWKYRIVDGYAEIYNDGAAAVIPTTTTGVEYIEDPEEEGSLRERAVKIPKSINGYAVTRIGENALSGCQGITYLGLPDTVTQIADGAFAGCSGLRAIASCNNVPFNCTDGKIDLPGGLESLGANVFSATKLRSLVLPTTLGSIDGNPFLGCKYLSTVSVEGGNPSFSVVGNALYDKKATKLIGVPSNGDDISLSIAKTAVEIGEKAFAGCVNLESVRMPDTLRTIGIGAFSDCSSIRDFAVPASVTTIGSTAFANCDNLKKVSFGGNAPTAVSDIYDGSPNVISYVNEGTTGWPSSDWCGRPLVVVSDGSAGGDELSFNDGAVIWHFRIIGDVAEIYLDGGVTAVESESPITSLTLPDSLGGYLVKGIGEGSLANLRGLTSITVPLGYEWIGDGAFTNCTSLASISLPATLRTIRKAPFTGTAISTLALPDSVSEITGNPIVGATLAANIVATGTQPFFSTADGILYDKSATCLIACPAAHPNVEIAKSVVTIGQDAFAGNTALTALEIPASVKSIKDRAFADCPSLERITYCCPEPQAADNIYTGSAAVISCIADGVFGWPAAATWKDRPLISATEAEWACTENDGKMTVTGKTGDTGDIVIPATLRGLPVTAVAPDAFNNVTGITSFAVAAENTAFSTRDGILYSGDGKTLIRVPDTYELPGVKRTTVTESSVTVTVVPRVNADGTDGTTYTTNSVTSTPKIFVTEEPLDGTVPYAEIFNGISAIADYAFYNCGEARPSVHSETEGDGTAGTTGFIGDDVYLRLTTSISSSDIDYLFPVVVPAGVSFGPLAFAGSCVTSVAIAGSADPAMPSPGTFTGTLANPEADISFDAKSSYTGWIARNGTIVGTVTVKTGAISRGKMKVTATRQLIGEKKTTIHSTEGLVPAGYDLIIAKSDTKAAAFEKLRGKVWCLALATVDNGGNPLLDGYSILSVRMSAKGKAKITGSVADGTKISVSAQAAIVEGRLLLPIGIPLYSGKKGGFAILLDLTDGLAVVDIGKLTVINRNSTSTATLGVIATGTPAQTFTTTSVPTFDSPLPEGYTTDAIPEKWKLRYTAKTGLVNGSFKALADGRRKSVTVKGIVIDGTAYCSAVVKKTGSAAVTAR